MQYHRSEIVEIRQHVQAIQKTKVEIAERTSGLNDVPIFALVDVTDLKYVCKDGYDRRADLVSVLNMNQLLLPKREPQRKDWSSISPQLFYNFNLSATEREINTLNSVDGLSQIWVIMDSLMGTRKTQGTPPPWHGEPCSFKSRYFCPGGYEVRSQVPIRP